MNGWTTIAAWSPLLTLLVGLAASLGLYGFGLPVARAANVPSPFRAPTAWLTGALILAAVTQTLGLLHAVNAASMGAVALALGASALVTAGAWLKSRPALPALPADLTTRLVLGLVVIVGLLHLLVAVAPTSRHDEAAYHILIPARLLADGGFVFHPLPFEATVLPQLGWQISQTVLHALGRADAAAVMSATAALMIAWLGFTLVRRRTRHPALAGLTALALLGSGYSIVFMTTIGPHAFQYLATMVGVLAALWGDRLLKAGGRAGYALTIGVAAAAMILSKLPMVPMAFLVTTAGALWVWRDGGRFRAIVSHYLVAGLLVALTAGPLAIWMFVTTGSPGGVTTLTAFANPAFYDGPTLDAYRTALAVFVETNTFKPVYEASYWNSLIILGALAYAVVEPSRLRRLVAGGLLLVQVGLIVFVLPMEIRHLGGIQYALFVAAAAAAVERWDTGAPLPRPAFLDKGWWGSLLRRRPAPIAAAVGVLALAPWLAVLVWFCVAFAPVSLGLQAPRDFIARYTPLSADLRQLNQRLPPDAVLYVAVQRGVTTQQFRPPMWYAPRRAVFHPADVSGPAPAYVLVLRSIEEAGKPVDPSALWLPSGYGLGDLVLSNPAACYYPQRVPGGACGLTDLTVYSLKPDTPDEP